jgi:hypothetical protein
MRFECEFMRPCDGARKTLFVDLTSDEVASVNAARNSSRSDVLAAAYALRHMYQIAPDGFQHLQKGVKPAPELVTELPAR